MVVIPALMTGRMQEMDAAASSCFKSCCRDNWVVTERPGGPASTDYCPQVSEKPSNFLQNL